MIVQSILFDKDKYTKTKAKKWLKDHGFKIKKIDETENYLRFRQRTPEPTKSYKTKRISIGIKFVLMK